MAEIIEAQVTETREPTPGTAFDKTSFYGYTSKGFHNVEGWVVSDVFWLLDIVNDIHYANDVRGGIMEIGVHHGRFFIALEQLCRPEERALAIDLFDMQDLNVDHSGSGNHAIFLENCHKYCRDFGRVDAWAMDSLEINASKVIEIQKKYGSFRFISVDGGHTAIHVQSDLRLADQLLSNGGIVLVDDFFNPFWPGVAEGTLEFLRRSDSRLVPVCLIGNKLALATLSWHQKLLKSIRSTFWHTHEFKNRADITIAGVPLVVVSR